MRIDGPAREVVLKVVYYGPGMAGKTTNLTVIHDRVPSQAAGDLVMVDTHSERTLRFDLLAVDMGEVRGHQVRFDFYTVPGQSYYAATRRAVLAGADAVVFVADSRREALDENIEAMNEMLGNLRHHAIADDVPVVMQYNKQDLPTALKPEQLEPLMNVRGWPSVPAVAVDGQGVMETMRVIADLALERARRSDSGVPQAAADQAPAVARSGSWLISCYRCQAMLEIGNAAVGMVYACGVCGSALEVMDPERGLTRAPAPGGGSGSGPRATVGDKPRDDSAYGMQVIPEQTPGAGALGAARGAPAQLPPQVSSVVPFEVPGYDLVAPLDESVQGRRARVRERSSGRNLRALTISTALMRQPGYQQALEPHVRLASQVKHPYILPLAALQPTRDAAALFSTDPADYEPLGHILARRRALAPPHAMGIIRQLALALEEAARHGVVHGWLRPDVVLVSPEGNVLLDELAVPKNHRFLVRELSGASAATEYYLAPEHLSDEIRSDVRADIFMLGALLFRMMTGEGLVTGYNAHEALHKVVANGARTLRSVQGSVSRDLDLFFQKLVAAERKDRFQGYREVIDTLDRFGGGAKRQTLRLTSNISNPAPGTGSIRRSGTITGPIPRMGGTGTGAIPRIGTGTVNRTGTGTARRVSRTASGEIITTTRRKEPDSSTGIIVMVVVAVLLIGGAVGFYVLNPTKTPTRPTLAPLEPMPEKPKSPEQAPGPTAEKPKPPGKPAFPYLTPGGSGPDKPAPTAPGGVDSAVGGTPPPPTTGTAAVPPKRVVSEERVGVILEIGVLERSEHFAEALLRCETLPNEEDTKNVSERVRAKHDARRLEVEKEAAAGTDPVLLGALLTPPQTFWGLPGDADWAKGLAAAAEKRLGRPVPITSGGNAEEPKEPGLATTPPVAPVVTPPPTAPPVVAPVGPEPVHNDLQHIAQLDSQVTAALLANNQALVQQQLASLPDGAPETAAIKHKVVLWNSRGDVLARIISEHPPAKLRVRHPTTNELWDVTAATATGMTITSPNDSRTDLTWAQVSIKEVAELFRAAAAVPAAKGDDHALATILLLASGESDLANVQLRKAKGVIAPEVGGELEILLALARQRQVNDMIAKGNDAEKAGNAKLLQDALEALRKLDKAVFPQAVEPLARFEAAFKNLGPAKPGDVVAVVNRDKLDFDNVDDLAKGFPERSTNWQVSKGLLSNQGDNAWLDRRDLDTAKAVSMVYQLTANKGGMVVNFRSVQVIFDFSANVYEIKSKVESRKPKTFAFMPKVSNYLRIEARDNGTVSIDLNNGRETTEVRGGDLSPALHLSTNGGAQLLIDDLEVSRGFVATPGGVPVTDGGSAFAALNLVPLGKVTLKDNAVVMPASPDSPSGIAMPVREGMIGASIEAKGSGKLRVQFGEATSRSTGTWVDLDLTAAFTVYKVVWKDGVLAVTDHAGITIVAQKIVPGPHTHLLITALQDAELKSPPKPTYP